MFHFFSGTNRSSRKNNHLYRIVSEETKTTLINTPNRFNLEQFFFGVEGVSM